MILAGRSTFASGTSNLLLLRAPFTAQDVRDAVLDVVGACGMEAMR